MFYQRIFSVNYCLFIEDPSKIDDNLLCVYVKLLNDIASLEKYYKSILDIKKWMHEEEAVEKYPEIDTKKSDSKINDKNPKRSCIFYHLEFFQNLFRHFNQF